jgi:NitT/TauT family transport system ATP-binding protein
LAFRQFDVAHMLSPMPVASMLGLGSNPSPSITPFSLGRGGNAITLSVRLFSRMQQVAELADDATALEHARALARVVQAMKSRSEAPLTFGMTYPFSSHNYEFRYWLAAGGVDPDVDVRLVVVPPPMTSDALAVGAIDGFCVGAPWNMIASERGLGRIVAAKQDIWPSAPEKVLGIRPDWAQTHRDTVLRLLVALDAAARWCDEPANHSHLAEALADTRHVGAPVDILRRVLAGEFSLDARGNRRIIENYFTFHREHAAYPRPSQALWIYSQMIRWGQTSYSEAGVAAVNAAFRPDLYRAALGEEATPADGDLRTEGERPDDGFMDGHVFDPEKIVDYVRGFPIAHRLSTQDGPRHRG